MYNAHLPHRPRLLARQLQVPYITLSLLKSTYQDSKSKNDSFETNSAKYSLFETHSKETISSGWLALIKN